MTKRFFVTLGLLAGLASAASAQVVPGRFQVSVEGAWQKYAESSALKDSPTAGLHAAYFFNNFLGLGASVTASRPWTKGEYFPLVRHSYLSGDATNDTTLLYQANMRVTNLQVSLDATARYEVGRFAPFVTGGVGRYRIFLDPEQTGAINDLSGFAYQVGGGIEVQVAGNSGLRLSVLDNVLSDFDRDRFCINCTGRWELLREDRFPNPIATPPAKESTIHNLRFVGSFSFVPGESR